MAGRKRERLIERRKEMGLSQEGLAEALGVDSSTVARWERGITQPQPAHRPRLAKVLKVSLEEIGEMLAGCGSRRVVPGSVAAYGLAELECGEGGPGAGHAAQLHAWGALRTMEDIGVFVRSDMLTRRDILASSVTLVAGKALVDPVAGWLGTEPAGLPATDGSGRVGMSAVQAIEHTVRQFTASDASTGGGIAREAAVGQLKYTVDLAQHASYSEAVGNRLLTVIAELADRVGWMSHDAGMDGPAQRYFWYGLRAAHEAGTERAQLRAVAILQDMARQVQAAGRLDTASRLIDLAIDRTPDDKRRFNAVRASLWNSKASVLRSKGAAHLPEMDSYINLSFDLYHRATEDEPSSAVADYFPYACEAELASVAAASYLDLAHEDVRLTARAERHARHALSSRADGFERSRVFDQVTLARVRFRAGEPDQACRDGQQAIQMAAAVSGSHRVRTQLAWLRNDTAPHQQRPAVRELREQLSLAIAGRF